MGIKEPFEADDYVNGLRGQIEKLKELNSLNQEHWKELFTSHQNLKQTLEKIKTGILKLKHHIEFTDIDSLEDIDVPKALDEILKEIKT